MADGWSVAQTYDVIMSRFGRDEWQVRLFSGGFLFDHILPAEFVILIGLEIRGKKQMIKKMTATATPKEFKYKS